VDQYYNDSTGEGAVGKDGVGSWIGLYGLHVADRPAYLKSIAETLFENTKSGGQMRGSPSSGCHARKVEAVRSEEKERPQNPS